MTGGELAGKYDPYLGREYGPDVYEVEKGMVRRFLEAIGDENPRWERETPPTFPAALPPRGLLHAILNVALPLDRVLNGSSELEYRVPVRVGDTIAVTGKLVRVRETDGPRLLLFTEVAWTNQRGELAVSGRNTYVRY